MYVKTFLSFVLIFYCFSAFSQSLYEIEYYFVTDNVKESYAAFLERNDDGTGIIRVKYYDDVSKQNILVSQRMVEDYDVKDNGTIDSNILIFSGMDPKVLIGNKQEEYSPDYFWFEKNKVSGYYEPWAVMSSDGDKHIEGVVTSMKLLEMVDLTKDFVSQYFTEQDEFYQNLFNTVVRTIPPQQKNTKLFLLLVANTEDISIGSTCVIDKDATYSSFSQVAEYLGIQFIPNVIFGKNFSKKTVEASIEKLAPSPNDIVVFYYSGHGFSNVNDRYSFPFLDLRDKSYQNYGGEYTMNMEDIFKTIKSKGARLNLVLSDCCNADPSVSNIISTNVASTRSSSIGWNLKNCSSLFLNNQRASILMTAASKGELSAGNNNTGGIFTFNMRESLEKYMGPFFDNVSWQNIISSAQNQTVNKANHTLCPQDDKSFKPCKQKPVYILEAK